MTTAFRSDLRVGDREDGATPQSGAPRRPALPFVKRFGRGYRCDTKIGVRPYEYFTPGVTIVAVP
jgi:hypothetical protein